MPSVKVGDVELVYQVDGPDDGVPLLLISGLSGQLTGWSEEFVAAFVDRGFLVVRYDHRDAGISTVLEGPRVDLSAVSAALARGERPEVPYTLSDMADDAVSLLDHLRISSAHVFGVSMGGAIAQHLALEHRSRVRSLVLMSSAPDHTALDDASDDARNALQQRPTRPLAASMASGDRSAGLQGLDVPTLVIHGADDSLVRVAHGRHLADLIPDAHLMVLDEMGHDLPPSLWPQVIEAVTRLASTVEASTVEASTVESSQGHRPARPST